MIEKWIHFFLGCRCRICWARFISPGVGRGVDRFPHLAVPRWKQIQFFAPLKIEVEKGVVTLEGTVNNEAERELAITIAQNTDDVEKVINKLELEANS